MNIVDCAISTLPGGTRYCVMIQGEFVPYTVKTWTRVNIQREWCQGDELVIPREYSGVKYDVIYRGCDMRNSTYAMVPGVPDIQCDAMRIDRSGIPSDMMLLNSDPFYNIMWQDISDCLADAVYDLDASECANLDDVAAIGLGKECDMVGIAGLSSGIHKPGVRPWKHYLVRLNHNTPGDVNGCSWSSTPRQVEWRDGQAFYGELQLHGLPKGTKTVHIPNSLESGSRRFKHLICILPEGGTLAATVEDMEDAGTNNTVPVGAEDFVQLLTRDLHQTDVAAVQQDWEEIMYYCPPAILDREKPYTSLMKFVKGLVGR